MSSGAGGVVLEASNPAIVGTPASWGLPARFTSWRKGQFENVIRAVDSPKRFVSSCQPTGSGKSVFYESYSVMSGERSCALTVTLGLQNQLTDDFAEIGLRDIRGKGNYQCTIAPGITCEDGADLRCKDGRTSNCAFRRDYLAATKADQIVTNYPFWTLINKFGEGLGPRAVLTLDEAHAAPEALNGVLTSVLAESDVEIVGVGFPVRAETRTIDEWRGWAKAVHSRVTVEYAIKTQEFTGGFAGIRLTAKDARLLRRLRDLERSTKWLAESTGPWVFEKVKRGFMFCPLWPGPYAESHLFLNARKVLLTSATLRPKTLQLLGIPADDVEHWEVDTDFPADRMPVYFYPTAQVKNDMDQLDFYYWYKAISMIVQQRSDRKILIHTVSYQRQRDIQNNCKLFTDSRRRVFTPQDSRETRANVIEFKSHQGPAILISPSISTGYDFAYGAAEVNIIAKLAFPDNRSPIMKARTTADRSYGPYLMMQDLVQACGRAARAKDDRSETFIIDSQWDWVRGKHKDFAPTSFWRFSNKRTEITEIPPAPPKLDGWGKVGQEDLESEEGTVIGI